MRAAVAATEEQLGPIDVLVNNAGTDLFSFFVNSDDGLWDFVLGVNLRGVLAVTHAVLPGMQERRSGCDRQRRLRGRARRLAGLRGLLGREGRRDRLHQGDRARVGALPRALNAVAPGPIETPLLNAAPQLLGELGERLKQGMVNRRCSALRRARGGRGGDRVPRLR